jgi:lysophospholipid acyltransferase (LPLAT)-like uncharacterized protein
VSARRLLAPLAPVAIAAIYHTLARSYRYVVTRPDRLDALLHNGPVVLAMWHDQAFAAARFLDRRLHHGGLALTLIASQSRDGELVARLARSLDIPVVRGSTSRGGRGAILALHRALVKNGASPLIAPDGPRGPRHRAQSGAVLLSQFGQAPVQPIAFAPARAARLGSWDRMLVPRPWTRIAVALAEPRRIPRQLDAEGLEAERALLESTLDALEIEARAALEPSTTPAVTVSGAENAAGGMHGKKTG